MRAPDHQYSQKRQQFPDPRILRVPPCMTSTLVHNLPPVATRLLQHLRCQPLRMSRNKTRTKRVARNPQSRAATAGRSKINPWKVLQRPRPPTAPHPSLPRASPVCTRRDPISHSSPSNCLQKSPRRAPRARKAHTVGIPPSERADKTISSRPLRRHHRLPSRQ